MENWTFCIELTDCEREERKFKNARVLCLPGNLSKAYRTLVQKELATKEKIQALLDKDPLLLCIVCRIKKYCKKFNVYKTPLIGKSLSPYEH
jgi:hypothetical protein